MNPNNRSPNPQILAQWSIRFLFENTFLHQPNFSEVFSSTFMGPQIPLPKHGCPVIPSHSVLAYPHHLLKSAQPFFLPSGTYPHKNEPAHYFCTMSGKQCKQRRVRTVFTDAQLSALEKRLRIQPYLSTPEHTELSIALSYSESQVRKVVKMQRFFQHAPYVCISNMGHSIC
ncbi:hypothetical protein GN956_G7985 [Arapaima gigas]